MVEKGELLELIVSALDMMESELTANIRRSILSTARQIIGVKYSEKHTVYAQVRKEHKSRGGLLFLSALPTPLTCIGFRVVLVDPPDRET